jgi:lipopolysaccharide transport system permease protein
LLIVTILGINLIISTIGIFISDINQLWDLILLAGFWTAPIFFRGGAIYEKFPLLFYANPLSGLIINIRNAILYSQPPDWGLGLYNFIYTSLLLGIGLLLFNRFSHKAIEKL